MIGSGPEKNLDSATFFEPSRHLEEEGKPRYFVKKWGRASFVKEKTFIRWLGPADRSRQVMVLDEGEITRFVVQYETLIVGEWCPVVRYDTVHGFAHKDVLSPSGEVEKKVVISYSFNEAFTNAEIDIKLNWQRYKEAYLKKVRA